ncbi:MAG: hypothetical protein FJ125_14215, partial [Deltaproteobacteria bacterium]|nr:hypothetical protein [Deltaproteobacteria bacterium]
MKYAAGGVTVKTGEPTKVEIPSGRLRLSAWVNDPYSALGSTGSAQTGWGFFADPSIIQGWAGHLDDVSPVATAMWDSKTKGVTWSNPGCLPGAPEEKRISICREAVEKCHAAGIQMLAGYEYVTGISASQSSASLFASWLKGADDTTLEEHGKQIVDFLWTKIGADWDGVGFDIELGSLDASHAERFTRFYGLLADRLAGLGNKILA